MATLTIKNIPDEIYQALKAQAVLHHRSLNSEVIMNLELIVGKKKVDPSAVLAKARKLRAKSSKIRMTEKKLTAAKNEGRA